MALSLCRFLSTMAKTNPTITLNNGCKMPVIGFGTWKSKPNEAYEAVKYAIDVGYRHVDCAHTYGNEKEVGQAINEKIKEGVIQRKDIFVVSKLWGTYHHPDLVEKGLLETLEKFNLEFLDLYLMHSPMAFKDDSGIMVNMEFPDIDYVDTWKAMEKLVKKGLTRSIGISNFNEEQIERLLSKAEIEPVNNQVECHPYLNQKKLVEFCHAKGIIISAYSPLGSPDRPWAPEDDVKILDDPRVHEIAKRLNRTPGQVLVRFHIDRGLVVLPKSANKERIKSNFETLDFKLSESDMNILMNMDKGESGRYVPWTVGIGHKNYPFGKV